MDDHDESLGITYERMRTIIEGVLVECGYYDIIQDVGRRQHRRNDPLAILTPRQNSRDGHKQLKSA